MEPEVFLSPPVQVCCTDTITSVRCNISEHDSIVLEYDTAVYVTGVSIYESFHPGGTRRISAFRSVMKSPNL